MKKYPVTYKGKEYEVRWYNASVFNWYYCCCEYIAIYEVNKILKIKTYKTIYDVARTIVEEFVKVSKNDPNYHIEEVKAVFKLMELDEEIKRRKEERINVQRKQLEEWDGVIC